jgi:hypothetical protein
MGHRSRRSHLARITLLAALFASFIASTPDISAAAGARLFWTTPGDNGGQVRIAAYDLRISASPILGIDTLTWWNAAFKIDMTGKVPRMPGLTDSILLAGLIPSIRYYAILRSVDAAKNWSNFSNVAFFTPSIVTAVDEGGAPALVVGTPRPSPSSGRTEVSLDLPAPMTVEANVYDAQGRLARRLESGTLGAGAHLLRWDGTLDGGGEAGSGVYWILVAAGKVQKRVKLVVVR